MREVLPMMWSFLLAALFASPNANPAAQDFSRSYVVWVSVDKVSAFIG